MSKTHWKKLDNPEYLGAYSIEEGQDLVVTIEKVVREQIIGTGGKKEDCTVAYLKGQKPFIVNRTNAKMITKVVGSPYIEDWSGKSIKLYVSVIKAFGEDNVEALRVRNEKVKIELPELKEGTPQWENVLKGMANGYTIEQVEKKYKLSKTIKEKLNGTVQN